MPINKEKLAKLQAASRTGGKGSMRRKVKNTRGSSGVDDFKVMSQVKKLNLQNIPGVDEVEIYKEDKVLSFKRPTGTFFSPRRCARAARGANARAPRVFPIAPLTCFFPVF